MICGSFVALTTHAFVLEADSQSTRPAVGPRSALFRTLSRVFAVAAILGQAWTFLFVKHTPPGNFAALGFVTGAVVYVAPFLFAAFGCALYSYYVVPRPRSIAPIVEMVVLVGVGIALLLPAAYVITR
jgi:hypothetical protein